jgi:hypothetical protein
MEALGVFCVNEEVVRYEVVESLVWDHFERALGASPYEFVGIHVATNIPWRIGITR